MYIKEMTATFGRLENETLSLSPGLNVIHAPNEGGKSTWTTFLRVMLYGLNTRDRSPNAEKRRYMPWSGQPMQGRMELSTPQGDLTIIRRTQRANSPMGAFSAVYTDTTTPVDNLTAANCGEILTGVPQDIFERSAFIRQSGIAVDHSAALEQRIAALITTGEENTSYTASADRLRRQLNSRQANRTTGLIPQLNQKITAMQRTLQEAEALENILQVDTQSFHTLQQRQQDIIRQLTQHQEADRIQTAAQANAARDAFHHAQLRMKELEDATRHLPDRTELEATRGAILAFRSAEHTLAAAQRDMETAAQQLKDARSPLESHHLAGHTPESAKLLPLSLPPRPGFSILLLFLAIALAGGATFAIFCAGAAFPISLACGAALGCLVILLHILSLRRKQKAWELVKERRTQQHQAAVNEYTSLYHAATQANTAWQSAQTSFQTLSANQSAARKHILDQVQPFAPGVEDMDTALQTVEAALHRLMDLGQARRLADDAQIRWELVADHAVDDALPVIHRPVMSRQQLESILSDINRKLAELQRQLHTAQGHAQAIADPGQLRTELELLQQERDRLQLEYNAIELASQVLAQANTSLQNRFSPALGEKSAKIFTKLTQGKYNKVVLSKDMIPSAQETGEMLPHEAAVLSQGAADQLYLAVRLAICQLLLPSEDPTPILLDDALVTFDDQRMAAALDHLVELSRGRQILLLTCQDRERRYLSQAHPAAYHAISL